MTKLSLSWLRLPKVVEENYRAKFLRDDALQASLGVLIFILILIPTPFADYEFFGLAPVFYRLLVLRLAMLAVSVFVLLRLRRLKSHVAYDRLLGLWQLGGVAAITIINLSRPASYATFVVLDVATISAIYVVFRTRLAIQTTLALLYSLADMAIILFTRGLPQTSNFTIANALLLINCLGMLAVWRLEAARRSEYLAEEQEARAKAEEAAALAENRRLEAERHRQSRLEAIGTLAGGIAHDFNNALTGIMGNIELAYHALTGGEKDEAHARLKDAQQVSEQAKKLSRQLLTFAKGDQPALTTLALAPLIRSTVALALHGARVRAELALRADLWPVEADESQLTQVLSNLIINAKQAMPDGGIVKIGARNMVRSPAPGTPAARYVQITVEDSGAGIPEEHLDKIFDPFFSTREGGFGLGLSVAYSIVKKHGGTIDVQSIHGAGTIFYVYLPASTKPVPPVATAPAAAPPRGKGRVLLMDDDEAVRQVLARSVTQGGYAADAACDGEEACALYEQALRAGMPYDAVILDLTIPGGRGGQEVVRELRLMDPAVKAIASSGYSDDPVMADCRAYGFRGALAKPYSIAELLMALDRLIRQDS